MPPPQGLGVECSTRQDDVDEAVRNTSSVDAVFANLGAFLIRICK